MKRSLSSYRAAAAAALASVISTPSRDRHTAKRTRSGMALLAALLLAGAATPAASAAQLALSWTDNSDNEIGFHIERSTDGSSYTKITTVAADTVTYVDTGLPESTLYWYRVAAYNGAGSSSYSNIASATTPTPTPAPVPMPDPEPTGVLLNGAFESFENGLAVGWGAQNSGGVAMTLLQDTGHAGQAQKIAITSTSGWGMFFYQKPVLTLGQTYMWTFWYKTEGAAGVQDLMASLTNGPHSEVAFDLPLSGTGGTWQEATKTFTYENPLADMLRIAATTTGVFWIDSMTLVETDEPVPANSAPGISPISDRAVSEGNSTGAIAFSVSDAETAASSLAVTGHSSNPALVPNGNIVFGGSAADRTVTVTPLAGQTGTCNITVFVSDGELSSSSTFTVTVRPGEALTAEPDSAFQSTPLVEPQTGAFSVVFDVTPSTSELDAVIGLSSGEAASYEDLAVIVRFNAAGEIAARNGGAYESATKIPYVGATTYHVRLEVDVTTNTYSAYVTPPNGIELTIGTDFAFRSEQAGVTSLDSWTLQVNALSTDASVSVSGFAAATHKAIVAPAALSPDGGLFGSPQTVTMNTATAGASIRYTVDGSTPTATTGILYTGPVTLASNTNLRAIACLPGMTDSAVTTAFYTITPPQAPSGGPRYYFGNFGSDSAGSFGLIIRENATGAFLATLDGHPKPIEATGFSLTDSGAFTFSAPDLGTVTGQVTDHAVSGTISSIGASFTGTLEIVDGNTKTIAGLYQAVMINSSAGRLVVLAGPNGRALLITEWDGTCEAVLTPLDANGSITATTASGSALQLTAHPTSGRITGGFVSPSASHAISGIREGTVTSKRLINTSVRAHVNAGAGIMIAGFVIEGSGTKQVLIRGIGPALTEFGVPDTLADPMLTVFRQGSSAGSNIIAQNDDWGHDPEVAAAAKRVFAFALPAGSKDAALKLDLPAGIYTAHVSGVDSTLGAALVEVYDAGSATDSTRLSNISLRGNVGVGDDSVIAGFVVNGDAPKRLLIRAVGPELARFAVPGTLTDPLLKIYQRAGGTNSLIAHNNEWGTDAAVVSAAAKEVGAFSLTPGSTTAAMVLWLEPGIYTAQGTSNDSSSGIAVVEVYELP